MPTLGNPNPRFLKFVAKPASVGNAELAKAQPVYIDGLPTAGEPAPATWASITGKPATFPPAIGTTATTAKAGNYVPAWADVTGKPTTFAPAIGTSATTAAAGNHVHAASTVTVTAASGIVGANAQAVLADLAARVVALEAALAALS